MKSAVMVRQGRGPLNDDPAIRNLLAEAVAQLAGTSDSARLDAELLLARALDVSRTYLVAHPEDVPDPDAIARFQDSVQKRLQGMPMAYISGSKEFWSLEFAVSADTLVPRPETEILVDRALSRIPRKAVARILDLGTGCGAVALAIARERPLCEITATDISRSALAVARMNAQQLSIPNIEFLCGDWLDPVAGNKFDVVVSNPPYVASNDPALDKLSYEPQSALVAGDDGLDNIRLLAATVGEHLQAEGWFLFEHGAMHEQAIAELMTKHRWSNVRTINDYAGLPRVTEARCP